MSGDSKNDGLPTLEQVMRDGLDIFDGEGWSNRTPAGTPLLAEINAEMMAAMSDAPGFYIKGNEYGRFEVREKRDGSDVWHASFKRLDIAEAWLMSWLMGQAKRESDGREVQTLPTGRGGN